MEHVPDKKREGRTLSVFSKVSGILTTAVCSGAGSGGAGVSVTGGGISGVVVSTGGALIASSETGSAAFATASGGNQYP